ncbi:enhancer of polycomb-like-domain-containing protein [Geranomyces variabilis]|nr:enhancer of polycomb-like-domain-containing protein [Geranomyces variabilis]
MVSGQTGSGLRSRKVDIKRALPVYRHYEVPDLDQSVSLNTLLLEATGVEKGEDKEHHLQAALIASHQTGHLRGEVIIPTPDASRVISDYSKYYSSTFHQPPSSIRFSTPIEDFIGCPYNLDDVDDEYLAKRRGDGAPEPGFSDDQFECIMWALERAGDDKVSGEAPTTEECKKFIEREEPKLVPLWPAIAEIYHHWKRRRYTERNGAPIQPKLKLSEDWDAKSDTDPYMCFRRREVKAIRKKRGRVADSQSLEKLRRLRDEMNRARQILELITNREAARKESIVLEHLIFEQRVLVRRLKKKLGIVTSEKESDLSPEVRRKKLRQQDSRDDIVKKIKIPPGTLRNAQMVSQIEHRLHEAATECDASTTEGKTRRKKMLEESQGWVDVTENPHVPPLRPRALRCWRSDLNSSRVQSDDGVEDESDGEARIPFGRRRVGRGGRVLLDRHVKQASWIKACGGKTRPIMLKLRIPQRRASSTTDVVDDFEDREAARWRFDNSDDEVDEHAVITMENTPSQMAFRVFTAGPKTEDDIIALMCKPMHPDQINPRSSTAAQRAEETSTAVPQVVRPQQNVAHSGGNMAMGANGFPKKRPNKALDQTPKPTSAAAVKKRQQEMLDPKATIIKAMMQQAQRQAQQQQQQYQQMQAQQQAMVHGTPGPTAGIPNSAPMAPPPGSAAMSNSTVGAGGQPLIQPSTPMLINGVQQSPGKVISSFGPPASMSVQSSPALASHAVMPGASSQPPQGLSNPAAINNQFNRQHQARQQMQVNQQMQMLRQHQLAQQARQQQQQLQQTPQLQQQPQQQHLQPGQVPQSQPPAQQLAQASQPGVTGGLLAPNPNGFTPQQLFYYQHVNNPANQINLQQQARAQAAMQNARLGGGLNQAALGAMLSQSNGTISAAQLQAFLAQQQQQQHQQLQQGHTNNLATGVNLQQHLLGQQKLKSGAAASSGAALPNMPAVGNVGINGSNGTPTSVDYSTSTPVSMSGAPGLLPTTQMLQQQQIQQHLQKQQLQQAQLLQPQLTSHPQQHQMLSSVPPQAQHQQAFKPMTPAQSPAAGSPAILMSSLPGVGSSVPIAAHPPAMDPNASDKENGPSISGSQEPQHAASPQVAAMKSAA